MPETPKFDIEKIIQTYAAPLQNDTNRKNAVSSLIRQENFISEEGVFALIGTGGTLSSGYSPKNENLVPGKYHAAEHVITDLKSKFMIIEDNFSSLDVFAKDSRDIETNDLVLLLDAIHTIKNKRVFIVSGTYMLPIISELLMKIKIDQSKTIGITGSMLPSGFTLTDAPMNIMSTVTAINQRHTIKNSQISNVMAVFHGQIYDTIESVKALDLHPKETDNLVIGYPYMTVPAKQE